MKKENSFFSPFILFPLTGSESEGCKVEGFSKTAAAWDLSADIWD